MIEIKAEKWVHNGYCIGYKDHKTYFISGAIPGEKVECSPIFQKSGFIHLRVERVLEPSREREESDCIYDPICGGCSFRHISYKKELELKQNLLKESMKLLVLPDIRYSSPNGYRNTIQLKVKNSKIGLFRPHSNEIIDITEFGCKHFPSEINEYLKNYKIGSVKELKLRYNESEIIDYDKQEVEFKVSGKKIKIPRNGFFQINRFLIEDWIREILENVKEDSHVLELFSGSGLISIFLSSKVRSLIGYELDKKSVEFARLNANKNHCNNLSFYSQDLYKAHISEKHLKNSTWVLNPPRKGSGKLILEEIQKYLPQEIIYSSCNYSTLSRDWNFLQECGYKIQFIKILDFFPRTPYFETLCKFIR